MVGHDGYLSRRVEKAPTKSASDRDSSGRSSQPPPYTDSFSTNRPHRHRSNSENSATELRKERNEKERRHERSTRERSSGTSKPRKNLDKIDRLDVTGFMTAGGFHHDGPFDACNPHRNKNTKKAPVLAFAKDSTAMTMAAGPPSQPVYFGDHVNNAESFADYGGAILKTGRPGVGNRTASFDPTATIDPIHGHESVGLGTTTFLEGAPAGRAAMLMRTTSDNGARNEARPRATSEYSSGLGRKKSVLQKIRGAYKERAMETQDHAYASSPPSSPHHQKATASYFETAKEQVEIEDSKINNIRIQLTDEGGTGASLPASTSVSSSSKLSPLYRPASNGPSSGGATGSNGLIQRVKSLRVGGKKRSE